MSYLINANVPVGSALNRLGSLQDVNIHNPLGKDVLAYDSATDTWVNDDSIGNIVSMTQAQYDALSTAEKEDPKKYYYITDATITGAVVDDNDISPNKTWSSSKINSNKAGFIDTTNLITTIDTYNADYTATVDCWCIGFCRKGSASGNNAQVNLDSINIANVNSLENHIMQFPVKKGQHIKTRNDASGVYTLFVYGMI